VTRGVLVVALLCVGAPAAAQNHETLTILRPKGIAAAPDGLHTNDRIYRAYPGILYEIRAAVVGGDYPYTHVLNNEPAGMTINASTGLIQWTPATVNDDAADIEYCVTDASAVEVCAEWDISVQTEGFRFVNASSGSNSNAGTIGSPFQTLAAVIDPAKVDASDIVYFRAGTYPTTGVDTQGTGVDLRIEYNVGDGVPTIWLEYPGESAVIDLMSVSGSEQPFFRMVGDWTYLDGFELIRPYIQYFRLVQTDYGQVVRKLVMHGDTVFSSGSNQSMILTTGGTLPGAHGVVVQDSEFYDVINANPVKLYSTERALVEDNVFHDVDIALELKESNRRFTVRGNTFYNISCGAIAGNNGDNGLTFQHYGEILYNNIRDAGDTGECGAIRVNQQAQAGPTFIYRNTFDGRVLVEEVDDDNGPFTFTRNVIINSVAASGSCPAKITCSDVTNFSRLVLTNNLTGVAADNIIDADGDLIEPYLTSDGPGSALPKGHMLDADEPPAPSGPRRFRFRVAGLLLPDVTPVLSPHP
jgi:hypothetical protein